MSEYFNDFDDIVEDEEDPINDFDDIDNINLIDYLQNQIKENKKVIKNENVR